MLATSAFEADGVLDAVVIGGGQAGLAMAWHLARQRARFLVLDAGPRVGHVWRSRWDSLKLFTPAEYDALPGLAFPGRPGTYPTKDQVADYLEEYVAAFNLPVRLRTPVTRLSRAPEGDFLVQTPSGTLRARQVVVATGAFQEPFIPRIAGQFGCEVQQLHASQYRRPADLPEGPVLVVGAGNSGLQIAYELAASRRVAVAVGTPPQLLPQRLLGKDLCSWLLRLGLMAKPADSRLAQRVRSRGEPVIGFSRRRLRRSGIGLRPRLVGADGALARFADGSALEVETVLWATGYRPAYSSWIDIPGVLVGGEVVHRRGVTDVPGLYFLGLPWQHTRGSALLGFVNDDAAFLATQLRRVTAQPGRVSAVMPSSAMVAASPASSDS